jgi:hypothetical protein
MQICCFKANRNTNELQKLFFLYLDLLIFTLSKLFQMKNVDLQKIMSCNICAMGAAVAQSV